jgi:hypothetical protein
LLHLYADRILAFDIAAARVAGLHQGSPTLLSGRRLVPMS